MFGEKGGLGDLNNFNWSYKRHEKKQSCDFMCKVKLKVCVFRLQDIVWAKNRAFLNHLIDLAFKRGYVESSESASKWDYREFTETLTQFKVSSGDIVIYLCSFISHILPLPKCLSLLAM